MTYLQMDSNVFGKKSHCNCFLSQNRHKNDAGIRHVPLCSDSNKGQISAPSELKQTVEREHIEYNPWIKKMTREPTSETSSHRPVYSNNRPETTHPDRQRERKTEREREVRDRDKVQEWAQEEDHKKTGKAWIRPVATINKCPVKKGLI